MKDLFQTLHQAMLNNQAIVFVSVVADSGSTPRGSGARMLVGQNGRLAGTIGGGAVEYRSEQLAQEVLEHKQSLIKPFRLAPNQIEDLGMICGGNVTVYFQYIAGGNPQIMALCEEVDRLLAKNQNVWLITELAEDDNNWRMGIYSDQNGLSQIDLPPEAFTPYLQRKPVRFEYQGRKLYIEPLSFAGRCYIFGGGHISLEIVPLLSHLGFDCVVLEDRPEFANQQRFPQAKEVICGSLDDINALVKINADDYVLVLTRGHAFDYVVQKQVLSLPNPPFYLGVIGSRGKVAQVKKRLRDEGGISEALLERIYSPVGLPIKADTPAEIAISIAAELVLVRAERLGR